MLNRSKKDNSLAKAVEALNARFVKPQPKHTKLKKGAVGAGVITAVVGAVVASSRREQA